MEIDTVTNDKASLPKEAEVKDIPETSSFKRPQKRGAGGPKNSTLPLKKIKVDHRTIVVPANRKTPLKENWTKIVEVLVTQLKLQARVSTRGMPWKVELRKSSQTGDESYLQKAADFVDAFMKGFDLEDAKVLVRMEGLYVETFHMSDVKQTLKGDHMARAVGRVCGVNGRTKHIIENTTRCRLVIADETVHILGSYQNIQVAKRAVCDLIIGSPPNKVYGKLRTNASRIATSF